MSEHTLTRAMWHASALVLVAAFALVIFALMGTLQGPAEMPVPPSTTNYSAER